LSIPTQYIIICQYYQSDKNVLLCFTKRQQTVITHIEVESADKHDANALLLPLKNTDKQDMSPKELLADSLYGSDDNVIRASLKTHFN
jgi:hypothetical protein